MHRVMCCVRSGTLVVGNVPNVTTVFTWNCHQATWDNIKKKCKEYHDKISDEGIEKEAQTQLVSRLVHDVYTIVKEQETTYDRKKPCETKDICMALQKLHGWIRSHYGIEQYKPLPREMEVRFFRLPAEFFLWERVPYIEAYATFNAEMARHMTQLLAYDVTTGTINPRMTHTFDQFMRAFNISVFEFFKEVAETCYLRNLVAYAVIEPTILGRMHPRVMCRFVHTHLACAR